ncbi:MAG: hypothetical protein M1839_003171 [Geoglossum umbratile]|nr:MAG: hypothetical protein M1839_003171 [Geoglossum umbratile]
MRHIYSSPSAPSQIPTVQEIRASTNVISEKLRRTVVAVSDTFLVKYGRAVEEIEGWNLLFVEQSLGMPAPRLYAMFEESQDIFLVMEYIHGDLLEDVWSDLEEQDKMTIVGKLGGIIDNMRSLPSLGYFGSVLRGPLPNDMFWTETLDPSVCGPFSDGNELCLGLVAQLIYRQVVTSRVEFFKRHLPQLLGRHPPVFTHADIQRKNIIVQEIKGGQSRDYNVFIIDWESAGWYPSCWEYISILIAFNWGDDWLAKAEHFISPWPVEAGFMKLMDMYMTFY